MLRGNHSFEGGSERHFDQDNNDWESEMSTNQTLRIAHRGGSETVDLPEVPERWWNAFVGRAQEIGAEIPNVDDLD